MKFLKVIKVFFQSLTVSSATRYAVLILALTNQVLATMGMPLINLDDQAVSDLIANVFLVVSALVAAYKDNPTSPEGRKVNDKLKSLKKDKKDLKKGSK